MNFIKRIFHVFVLLTFLCGAVAFYAIKIEPYQLVVKTYPLEKNGEKSIPQITIVQVSDIQISPTYDEARLDKLVSKINELNPDIFLFTGDLYDNYAQYGPEEGVIAALSSIKAPLGKFAIYGNRDCGGGSIRRYSTILGASGFRLLTNEAAVVSLDGGGSLFIGGVDDYLLGSPDIAPILASMSENDSYRILMTHEPDTADSYANDGFDLILAGHSHGGQISIPFLGGPETAMAHKYRKGFYQLNSDNHTELYVNSGIGTSHYPVRFMVPPEITVFQLTLSQQEN